MSNSTVKQAVQAQFAGSAEAYVTSTVHANKPDLQQMVALAELRSDERVLDIATGGGHAALAFAPHVQDVVATDLTPAMLAAAERFIRGRNVHNVRFEVADAEALPFPDNHFDVVTCRVAPHHFPDVQQFVREVARVLRSGGRFVLVDTIAPATPTLDSFINAIERLRDPTHVREYTEAEWRALCADAALTAVHTETFTKRLPFDDWCRRARVSSEVQAELSERLRSASPEAYSVFGIETHHEQVVSFVLYSVLLVARKL